MNLVIKMHKWNKYIYNGNEEHNGTSLTPLTVSTIRLTIPLLNMWCIWHIRWKSTSESMGQIIRCASGVTIFTLTLETSRPHLSHISHSIESQEVTIVNCRTRSSPLYLAIGQKVSINNLHQKGLHNKNVIQWYGLKMHINGNTLTKKKTHRALRMFSQAFLDNLWWSQRPWGVGKLLTPWQTRMWDRRDKVYTDKDKRNK